MTPAAFHALLVAPETGPKLDAALAEDEALKQKLLRENNERLYLEYIRAWFRRTEAHE